MRILAAVLLPLLAPGQANAQANWSFAHPDATLVGAVRPGPLLSSPLLASAWTAAGPADPQLAGMMAMAKVMLGGIREIRFSVLDNGTPEPDVIALVDGTLDENLLGPAKGSYRRIDASTLLFATGASLEKAAARLAQATPVLQPRALAGTAALAGYDLWISGGIPNLPTGALKLPGNVRGIALGLSLRDNVALELALEASSPAAAEALLKAAHAEEPAQLRGALQSFADGNTARFRMNIPQAVAMEAILARSAPALTASAPKPLPAAPRRIVIQGLDDGPREIPLQ